MNRAGTRVGLRDVSRPRSTCKRADLVGPLSEFDAVLHRGELPWPVRRLPVDATGLDEEYLFVFAEYRQLTALRDVASKAADDATGKDRRLLDRFSGRVDGLDTTLSEFLEPDESASELLN